MYDKKLCFPLTSSQYGVYIEQRSMEDSTLYHLSQLGSTDSNIEPEKLAKAINAVIAAHPSLSARLTAQENGTICMRFSDRPVETEIIRLSDEEFEQRRPGLVRPFTLLGGKLSRFELYVTPTRTWVFEDIHHIVNDGSGMVLLSDEIKRAIEGEAIPFETYTPEEAAKDEVAWLDSLESKAAEAYWDRILDGWEGESAPERNVFEKTPAQGWLTQKINIDTDALKELRHRAGCSNAAFFNAVMAKLLSVYCGTDDVIYNTITSGRNEKNFRSTGMFIRTFPIRADFSGTDQTVEFLRRMQEQLSQSTENAAWPYLRISEKHSLPNSVTFAYQKDIASIHMIDEYVKDAEFIYDANHIEVTSLHLEVRLADGQYHVFAGYRKDQYSEDYVRAIARTYGKLAEEFLTCERISGMQYLSREDENILADFNRTEAPWERTDMVTLFKRQADRVPENTAVVFRDRRYTYRELDALSDRLAWFLHSKGIGRGDVVSVLIPRCEYMVTASLGILKSGAAYQPLDPTYPPERHRFMMEDAGSALLIADRELLEKAGGYDIKTLLTEEIPNLPVSPPISEHPEPEDTFILLYTSGTTGQPKGVMWSHSNVAALCAWAKRYFCLTEEDRLSGYASYGFDACAFDIYPALYTGASVYIVPEEIRLDLVALSSFLKDHRITHTVMTTQVGRQVQEVADSPYLKSIGVGGEALVPFDPAGNSFDFYNFYGPTECTVLVSAFKVDRLYHRIPIGKPCENVKLYVVDKEGKLLPPGAPGELWAAGPRVAKGYLNRPEKTEEVFVPNPFTGDTAYETAYRTGDIVRLLPEGLFDFIGRKDGQVKIRGFRIELPEIEEVIRQYPGVEDATVQAFDDPVSKAKYIAAYVVSGDTVDTDALSAFIREKKPPYMVPAVIMQIDRIPLNRNQKVDRKALPVPEQRPREIVAPRDENEKRVLDIAVQVLGTDDLGVTTDLYEAGMTSISSMRFNLLLSRAFERSVSIRDLKENPTAEKLAALLKQKEAPRSYEKQEFYELTQVQKGILAECMKAPDTTMYNVPFITDLGEGIDADRLEKAVSAAIDAHPYLKARLVAVESGDIMAQRRDEDPAEVIRHDRHDMDEGEESLVHPFHLIGGKLYRAAVITNAGGTTLFFDAHHIVFDGESLTILLNDIAGAYEGRLPEKESFTGFEASLLEKEERDSSAFKTAKEYFGGLLEGCDTQSLPPADHDDPHGAPGTYKAELSVSAEELGSFAARCHSTINALVTAAFGFVLDRHLGKEDCVFATVYNGRSDSRLACSVGMFVHTLPLRCRIRENMTAEELVRKTGEQLSESMRHDIYSFAEISAEHGVKADVLFVYEGGIGSGYTLAGRPMKLTAVSLDHVKAAITFTVSDARNGLSVLCEYDGRHYEEWSIASLTKSFENALKGLLREEKPGDISLLDEESLRMAAAFNDTATEYDRSDIVSQFRAAAAMYPGNNAVIFKDKKITYAEADRFTDRIAAELRRRGIGRGDVVSVLIPRCEFIAVVSLGILKSGAAYQPLDPSYPPERLQFMIHDAGAKLLIADGDLLDCLPGCGTPVLLTTALSDLEEAEPCSADILPEDTFILLYTSGTTGQPKGVMLSHGNLSNFAAWYRRYCSLGAKDVVSAYASYGFDACMMDLYPALTAGAAVCIVPEEMRIDLPLLGEYFRKNGVTHTFMTTQIGRLFAKEIKGSGIRRLLVGGEKLVPLAPPEELHMDNGYGPTECTIFATIQPVDRMYHRIPIGTALDNYKLYVVNGGKRQQPVGALGELWIAGHGVGKGYLNRPDLTQKVFTKNPFCDEPGYERVYHTGDIVRRLPDGRIDFIGRSDGLVKIRGFRIELAEVESAIYEYEGIREVTVQTFDEPGGSGQFLAAYFTSDKAVDTNSLRAFIRSKKPSYMVPAALMQLKEIPLNRNQKVDRRALPAPVIQKAAEVSYVPPATKTEEVLCSLYAEILGLERVSAEDSFFDIGGTSLNAAKIVTYAMNRGYPVLYKDIFRAPSPRELARLIDAGASDHAEKQHEAEDYDYSAINRMIAYNSMENIDRVCLDTPDDIGDIVLTGTTGFLGIHVLKAFLDHCTGRAICLVRKGHYQKPEERLAAYLAYYFGDPMEELFGSRILCVNGDLMQPESIKRLSRAHADVLINCAANVKHFVKDDILDRINYRGVETLIDICAASGMRLIQISTTSVAGTMENGSARRIMENELFFGQNVENDYVRTKFLAERAVLQAIADGRINGRVIRVGNLVSRYSDGEFQMNFRSNAFMRTLRSFCRLGQFPCDQLDMEVEFSQIDAEARAILTLTALDGDFTVFHSVNNHVLTMGDVIYVMIKHGFRIDIVTPQVFAATLKEAAEQSENSESLLGLVAYSNHDKKMQPVEADRHFTTNVLFRCGFRWPVTDEAYLEKVIEALDTIGFFSK